MQTMQLHETPFQLFIKFLKALRFSAVLILTGRVFQIFGLQNLRLLGTNATWFLLEILKFNLHMSQVTRFLSFFSNISFMKLGFKSLSVLYISIQRHLSQRMFILHLPDFSNSCSYDCSAKTSEFVCVKFQFYNTISLSCHEQVCLSWLRFERYFSHHRAT